MCLRAAHYMHIINMGRQCAFSIFSPDIWYGVKPLGQAKFSLLNLVIFKINSLNLACPHTKCMEPTGVTRSCNSRSPQDSLWKSRIRTPWDVFCMLYRYPHGAPRGKKVLHTNCRLLQLDFILKFIQYSY